MEESISDLWEKRSQIYETRIEGVLPKSFPPAVNGYLHRWMFRQVERVIPQENAKVLDLGCGYGRLSEEILKDFPKSLTFGIDISDTYVSLYNKNLSPRGKASRGDIRKLQFSNASFEVVFMVTTLMYITNKKEQEKAMKEIFRVLKPGGKFVIIERNPKGYGLITLGGFINKLRGNKFREITAVSFDKDYMKALISKSGGKIEITEGIPIWTLSLPLLIILSKLKININIILKLVSILDKVLKQLLTPSLYIVYTGISKK